MKSVKCLGSVGHQLLKTTTQTFYNISPWILHVERPFAVIHLHGLANLLSTFLADPSCHCVGVRHRNRNMKESTASIVKLVGFDKRRIDELENFEANTIASAQPCDVDFLQLAVVNLKHRSLWVLSADCHAVGAYPFEAEDRFVPVARGF